MNISMINFYKPTDIRNPDKLQRISETDPAMLLNFTCLSTQVCVRLDRHFKIPVYELCYRGIDSKNPNRWVVYSGSRDFTTIKTEFQNLVRKLV